MSDWIESGLPFRTYEGEPSFEETIGFDNLPGLVIETEHGIHLIGDMNAMLGGCDCCRELDRDVVVRRYMRVWQPVKPDGDT